MVTHITRITEDTHRRRYSLHEEDGLAVEWWEENGAYHMVIIPFSNLDMIALLNEGRL